MVRFVAGDKQRRSSRLIEIEAKCERAASEKKAIETQQHTLSSAA
jgi:hypothetical protein